MKSIPPKRQKAVQPRRKRSREKNGLIAWNHLSWTEQNQFTNAFHSDEARTERREALINQKNFDHDVSNLLYQYQQCMEWGNSVNAEEPKSPLIEHIWHFSERYKKHILNQLWQWMCIGDWKKFLWLAEYGEQHSQQGVLEVDQPPGKQFPQPNERLQHPQKSELTTVTLRSFAMLAGMRYEEVVFNSRPLGRAELMNPYMKEPVRQTGFVPEMLPTKSHLKEVVLKEWHRLTGNQPLDPASGFSGTLKRLGLAGLPKGKPSPLAVKSLSEEAKELRDHLYSL